MPSPTVTLTFQRARLDETVKTVAVPAELLPTLARYWANEPEATKAIEEWVRSTFATVRPEDWTTAEVTRPFDQGYYNWTLRQEER